MDAFRNLSGRLETPTNKLINRSNKHKRDWTSSVVVTMSTHDDEEAIQGILTNVVEEKVTIQKYTRETLARKVKFVSPRDMEHNGRMSLKVKKQLNYTRQDWKEHWESLLAPCVRAALHEKRNSMVANVMRAALLRKYRRRSQTCFLCITIAILLA